jgi:hypothetical protein
MQPRNCLNQDTWLSAAPRYSNSGRRMPAHVKPWPFCLFVICFAASNNLCAQQSLGTIRVASGLSSPLFVTAPPGDANRLFIVQQGGQIRILNVATGVLNPTPFLTVSNIRWSRVSPGPRLGRGQVRQVVPSKAILVTSRCPDGNNDGRWFVLDDLPLRLAGARIFFPKTKPAEKSVFVFPTLNSMWQLVEAVHVSTAEHHVIGDERFL